MSGAVETFTQQLDKLIRKFEADKPHYLSKGYPEAQARVDFITPFFKALGWDVENEAGLAHHDREVIVERGESDTTGRPDYNFRVGGQTKFFVEAKAPSEALGDVRHILQAKTYVWNTKTVFFVILTDFEEFRFYDASLKPDERKPEEGLLLKLAYADYAENAAKLWEFSRERIAAGSLDAMLPRRRRAERLRLEVDEAFLDEMTGWREELAKNIYKNNPRLTARQLNEVVQRLLDRIVFIRIAEDRKIIEKMQLWEAAENWRARGGKISIFDWLGPLFEKINDDFNGEIFKPNELLEKTQVDSEVLAHIIERLYPPRSPYRFDVIGVELLGSIYERYLGKTIRPTAKQVRVEEKPEVRKAGGVYYTPKYIVDYIVKNTVGKIIEGKTPKQIEKIRILDPACGSGSFLIGAFQCLIDYHVRYLTAHPKEARVHPLFPDLVKDENGEPRLSVIRKARILRNNLFGVDIDSQAVEITMMSLYLKALEGEKSQLPPKQSLLPELKYNIICGNSLIGPDIFKDVQLGLFGEEEKERINAFDWDGSPNVILSASEESLHTKMKEILRSAQDDTVRLGGEVAASLPRHLAGSVPPPTAGGIKPRLHRPSGPVTFGDIMRSGGFDCVIGNPPYIRIQHLKEWAPVEVEYYKEHYKSASSGNYDIYVCFVEKGLSVLNERGKLGFILPHKFFNAQYGEPLRGLIASGKHLSEVVHFGDQQVFEGASNYTCLLFLEKSGAKQFEFLKVNDLLEWRATGTGARGRAISEGVTASPWIFQTGRGGALMEKLNRPSLKLADVTSRIFQGLKTGADAIFILQRLEQRGKRTKVYSKHSDSEQWLESALLHPLVKGGDSDRYFLESSSRAILFPYIATSRSGAELIPSSELKSGFRLTWEYLDQNKAYREGRERGLLRGPHWYAYTRNQALDVISRPKIFTPDIAIRSSFSLDEEGTVFFTGGVAGGYGVLGKPDWPPLFILGLLNSKVLEWYVHQTATVMRGGYYSYESRFIRNLPIPDARNGTAPLKARRDKMEALVERMLELSKRRGGLRPPAGARSAPLPPEIERLDREIASTDAEIDNLVYELYGITDDERKIIEGA